MFNFIAMKSKNKLWGILVPIFLLVITANMSVAADSHTVYCYSGENKIGELSANKIDEVYWIPLKNVAQLLNMKISSIGDEVVVSNNNLTVKVVKNASAARVGNMLISLIEIPREIDGSLCLSERSVNILFQRALGKKPNDQVSFRMEYGLSDSAASGSEKGREPILYSGGDVRQEKPAEIPVPPATVTPSGKNSPGKDKPNQTLAEISEIRWNVTQQKIRVVLACAGDKEPVLKKEKEKIVVSSAIFPDNTKSQAEDRIQLKKENGSLIFAGKWLRA
ncbi:MAG: hypothetical protein FWG09_08250, partial [Synergistaceae bacterium]|nr:hypothetical protein [Synergistaceae bacterium]